MHPLTHRSFLGASATAVVACMVAGRSRAAASDAAALDEAPRPVRQWVAGPAIMR
jgi:hypothetical protein